MANPLDDVMKAKKAKATSARAPAGAAATVPGQVYVDPATGERRVRIGDLRTKPSDDTIKLSLYEILRGEIRMDLPDDKVVRLKPLTLGGLAVLQEMYSALGGLESLSGKELKIADYIKFATVLVNQDMPLNERVSEDEVGRMLNAENMPLITALINDVMTGPLFGSPGTTPAPTGASQNGKPSFTSSLASTAGSPTKLPG